jgi:ABC-type branched-subunit amino acid transport system ATPase component
VSGDAPVLEAVLEARNLVAGYSQEVDILNGVSLALGPREIVAVVGPNGAGKSTLIKVLVGLVAPRQGQVMVRGKNITGRRPSEIVRLGIGYVPQRENVFGSMTVAENLELGAMAVRPASPASPMQRVLALFPLLAARRRQVAGTLSGGERQMLAIGRAMMADPDMLLLDEPSAGLAPLFVDAMFEQLEAVNRAGVAILMVEQDARRALELAHRGYVLELGRNRLQGSGRALLDDPLLAQMYLG